MTHSYPHEKLVRIRRVSNPSTSIDPGSLEIGFLVLIQNAGFVREFGTNSTKRGHKGRKPVSKKLLGRMWLDLFICVTWLIHTCDMTHPCVWHDWFVCVWHDSFTCVTWLIHVCVTLIICELPPFHLWRKHANEQCHTHHAWKRLDFKQLRLPLPQFQPVFTGVSVKFHSSFRGNSQDFNKKIAE